jgi:hypothetical protein
VVSWVVLRQTNSVMDRPPQRSLQDALIWSGRAAGAAAGMHMALARRLFGFCLGCSSKASVRALSGSSCAAEGLRVVAQNLSAFARRDRAEMSSSGFQGWKEFIKLEFTQMISQAKGKQHGLLCGRGGGCFVSCAVTGTTLRQNAVA